MRNIISALASTKGLSQDSRDLAVDSNRITRLECRRCTCSSVMCWSGRYQILNVQFLESSSHPVSRDVLSLSLSLSQPWLISCHHHSGVTTWQDSQVKCLLHSRHGTQLPQTPRDPFRHNVSDEMKNKKFFHLSSEGTKEAHKGKSEVRLDSRPWSPKRKVEVELYSFFNLGARWWRVVNATPRPLYPR